MRILVVDDEREIADYVSGLVDEIMRNQAKTEVYYSGSKALQRIKEVTFDLVISDIVMPVTDGFSILEYIAKCSRKTEVIFLSVHREFDYIYKANQLKAIKYIVKTEDVKTIKKIIEQVINGIIKKKIEQAQVVIDNLEIEKADGVQSEENLIESICSYILDNLSNDLNINQIAKIFHYNATYLSRIFKRYKNCKLSSFIQEQKMEKAKAYLLESEYAVAKIANLVGYQSPQAFNRVFRRKIQMTPQAYRRMCKKAMREELG